MKKIKLDRSDELNDYIKKAIEAAEHGCEEGIMHAISSMTYKDFVDAKIVFDLTKLVATHPKSVQEMIQAEIKKTTSADFQKRVSFLMPLIP